MRVDTSRVSVPFGLKPQHQDGEAGGFLEKRGARVRICVCSLGTSYSASVYQSWCCRAASWYFGG